MPTCTLPVSGRRDILNVFSYRSTLFLIKNMTSPGSSLMFLWLKSNVAPVCDSCGSSPALAAETFACRSASASSSFLVKATNSATVIAGLLLWLSTSDAIASAWSKTCRMLSNVSGRKGEVSISLA